MLIITIELVPGGFEPHRRTLGSMRISNLSDLADLSDYAVDLMEAANPLTGAKARTCRTFLRQHDRRQSAWAIAAAAAAAAAAAGLDAGADWVDW